MARPATMAHECLLPPPATVAQVCSAPTAMDVTPVSLATSTGVALLDVELFPSCPAELNPQHFTPPATIAAHTFSARADRAATPLQTFDVHGRSRVPGAAVVAVDVGSSGTPREPDAASDQPEIAELRIGVATPAAAAAVLE